MSFSDPEARFLELREPLHQGLQKLQIAAGAVADAEPRMAMAAIETAFAYLRDVLLPWCHAEQSDIFPVAEEALGAPGAMDVLRRQHAALLAMAGDLGKLSDALRHGGDLDEHRRYLFPLLHGLYGAIRVHIESEDAVLLKLLEDNLPPERLTRLLDLVEAHFEG